MGSVRQIFRIQCAVIILAVYSCNSKHPEQVHTGIDTVSKYVSDSPDKNDAAVDTSEYAQLYIVIADTGKNYDLLDAEMYVLSRQYHIAVDTMDRYYNRHKNEIVVSENDDDEMYRGEYYPRRDAAVHLSLEYYRIYHDISSEKNIALVTGICEHSREADSVLELVKPYSKNPFIIKSVVYEGCMH